MTASDDTVSIVAADSINESLTADAAVDVFGGVVSLVAGSGIGDVSAFELTSESLVAASTSGPVVLHHASSTAVTVSSLTTGGGFIELDQTGGGDLTVATITTMSGDIRVSVDLGELSVMGPVVASGSGTVSYVTDGGSVLLSGTTTAEGGMVSVDSNGAIEGSGQVTSSSVDLSAVTGIGDLTSLQLSVAQVSAETFQGNVVLSSVSTTDVTIEKLTSGVGNLLVNQTGGGSMTLGVISTHQGAVSIANTDGDITVEDLTVTGVGSVVVKTQDSDGSQDEQVTVQRLIAMESSVSIISTGAIDGMASPGGMVAIDAQSIELLAGVGMGQIHEVVYTADHLSAGTESGGLVLRSVGTGAAIAVESLTTGGGDIVFEHADGDLEFTGTVRSGNIVTPGGDIFLSGTDEVVISTTATISSQAGVGGVLAVDRARVEGLVAIGAGDITIVGGGQDVVIDIDIITPTTVILSAPVDIIIGATIQTTMATADIELHADSDGDGQGGVWIQTSGQLDSAGVIVVEGSHLVATTGVPDVDVGPGVSVFIQSDTLSDQVLAAGAIQLTPNSAVPQGNGMRIDGVVRTDQGDLSVTSAGRIDGDGKLIADNLQLSAFSGIGDQTGMTISASHLDIETDTGAIIVDSVAVSDVILQQLKTSGGDVHFTQSGAFGLEVIGPVTSGSAAVNGGSVTFDIQGGLTVSGVVSTLEGSGGQLHIGGATINAAPILGAGDITLSGGGQDTVIDVDQISETSIVISALRDIIIRTHLETIGVGVGVTLTADSDQDGSGGVLVTGTGRVDASGDVMISGSDLFVTVGIADAIVIEVDDQDAQIPQVVTAGRLLMVTSSAAPADADITIDGSLVAGQGFEISAIDSIGFGDHGDLQSDFGDIFLIADMQNLAGGGQVVMSEETMIDAARGRVRVVADGPVGLGQIRSGSDADVAIDVTSSHGAIVAVSGSAGAAELIVTDIDGGIRLDSELGIGRRTTDPGTGVEMNQAIDIDSRKIEATTGEGD
ncbi:MAG: hypothetical protein ABGZ17_28830, partial [Planctomycetaceae bacterium]